MDHPQQPPIKPKPKPLAKDGDTESCHDSHYWKNNSQKPSFGIKNTKPEAAKNWETGMQETMHSLEKRIEKQLEKQMNKIKQEIKQIQNKLN